MDIISFLDNNDRMHKNYNHAFCAIDIRQKESLLKVIDTFYTCGAN